MRNLQTHFKIKKRDTSKYAILTGDPFRLDEIKTYLKSTEEIDWKREFRVVGGNYKGVKVLVVSTGIGSPSTAIVVEELIKFGTKVLIRVGTCGGAWQKNILLGSFIIPLACIRDEGTTKEYISLKFPAVADLEVVNTLVKNAEKRGVKYFVGINRTHDAFYNTDADLSKWLDLPIISSEMETSSLFVISTLRKVKSGAVLAVNAKPEPIKKILKNKIIQIEISEKITKKLIDEAFKIALETILDLSKKI